MVKVDEKNLSKKSELEHKSFNNNDQLNKTKKINDKNNNVANLNLDKPSAKANTKTNQSNSKPSPKDKNTDAEKGKSIMTVEENTNKKQSKSTSSNASDSTLKTKSTTDNTKEVLMPLEKPIESQKLGHSTMNTKIINVNPFNLPVTLVDASDSIAAPISTPQTISVEDTAAEPKEAIKETPKSPTQSDKTDQKVVSTKSPTVKKVATSTSKIEDKPIPIKNQPDQPNNKKDKKLVVVTDEATTSTTTQDTKVKSTKITEKVKASPKVISKPQTPKTEDSSLTTQTYEKTIDSAVTGEVKKEEQVVLKETPEPVSGSNNNNIETQDLTDNIVEIVEIEEHENYLIEPYEIENEPYEEDQAEPFTDEELEYYKELLLKKREEFTKQLNGLRKKIMKALDQDNLYERNTGDPDSDFVNESSEFMKDELLINRLEENLHQIEDALEAIKDKTYGICQRTGKRIEKERLQVIPWARYCKAAQDEFDNNG